MIFETVRKCTRACDYWR